MTPMSKTCLPQANPTWPTSCWTLFLKKEGQFEQTTWRPAAQTNYIDMVSSVRVLVAYQSCRNLGLCSSISNQRFQSLPERESTRAPGSSSTGRWSVLLTETNPAETATVIQNSSLPLWDPWIPKALSHSSAHLSMSEHLIAYCLWSFIVPCVKVSVTPQKRCCFCQGYICIYILDSPGRSAEHVRSAP